MARHGVWEVRARGTQEISKHDMLNDNATRVHARDQLDAWVDLDMAEEAARL